MLLNIQVTSPGGELCKVQSDSSWTVALLQAVIETAVNIPAREQRLCHEEVQLRSDDVLGAHITAASATVLLVRRLPEQARWLEIVTKRPGAILSAPPWVREDPEIVRAAMTRNPDTCSTWLAVSHVPMLVFQRNA